MLILELIHDEVCQRYRQAAMQPVIREALHHSWFKSSAEVLACVSSSLIHPTIADDPLQVVHFLDWEIWRLIAVLIVLARNIRNCTSLKYLRALDGMAVLQFHMSFFYLLYLVHQPTHSILTYLTPDSAR